MSFKSFVKEHCPDVLLPLLRFPYRATSPIWTRRLCSRIMDFLPYYQDELSREILSDRLAYIRTGDNNIFMDRMEKLGIKFAEFPYGIGKGASGIVVLYDSESPKFHYTKRVLASLEWPGTRRMMTLKEFLAGAEISPSEVIVPVLTYWGEAKFATQLAARRISSEVFSNPYFIREDLQYFDVFSPVEDEVVVDAGSYDGTTALQFLEWGGGKVKHVYSFEFDPENAAKCEENLKPYSDRVTIIKKGTWDKDEVMHADASGGAGSNIRKDGSTEVQLTSIDSALNGEAVTFIKMDVEGAELKSLMGARSTIIKNHPRLAICAYHKSEDLYELPEYILSIVPEYKFYLRHYCSCNYETVLYAYCD